MHSLYTSVSARRVHCAVHQHLNWTQIFHFGRTSGATSNFCTAYLLSAGVWDNFVATKYVTHHRKRVEHTFLFSISKNNRFSHNLQTKERFSQRNLDVNPLQHETPNVIRRARGRYGCSWTPAPPRFTRKKHTSNFLGADWHSHCHSCSRHFTPPCLSKWCVTRIRRPHYPRGVGTCYVTQCKK